MSIRRFSQIVLGVAIAASLAGAVVLLVRSSTSGGIIEIVLPTPAPAPELKVYVTGAVRNPDVYIVRNGDRLAEVVEAAGGLTEDADMNAVNLAARVRDEDHWHIPVVGEVPLATPAGGSKTTALSGPAKVDLNSATAEELTKLPGIGPVLAQRIADHREANGRFAVVDDMLNVDGIGRATLDKFRDLVEVR